MITALERLRQLRSSGTEARPGDLPEAPEWDDVDRPMPLSPPEPSLPPMFAASRDVDTLGAICRRARTWPQAVALLLDVRGVPNGGAIGEDFFDALDALHETWDARHGGLPARGS